MSDELFLGLVLPLLIAAGVSVYALAASWWDRRH